MIKNHLNIILLTIVTVSAILTSIKWMIPIFAWIMPVAICFDADHPGLIRQIGLKEADILLLPSADWSAIVPYHSYMSVFRAIENGVSLVRPVSNGQTLAVDSRGRVLFSTQETATSGWVPVNKTKTIYPYINDLFVWMSILGLFVIIIVRKLFIPRLIRQKK